MILKTQRLILRPIKKSDWEDLVEGCNDFSTVKHVTTMPYPYKKKDALWWINKSQGEWRKKKKDKYNFSIILKEENKLIGGIAIFNINKKAKKCNTGSWINKKYRRKAYMTEAKIAINEFVFNKLKLNKMETSVFTTNKASRATQETMGYIHEGTRKQSNYCQATKKLHDEHLFGLLKKDWKKKLPSIKKKLQQKIKRLENKK